MNPDLQELLNKIDKWQWKTETKEDDLTKLAEILERALNIVDEELTAVHAPATLDFSEFFSGGLKRDYPQ